MLDAAGLPFCPQMHGLPPPPLLAGRPPCRLLEVGGERAHGQGQGRDAVTTLCMGQHSGTVLLLAGHASGGVRIWELKTQLGGGLLRGRGQGPGVHGATARTLAHRGP